MREYTYSFQRAQYWMIAGFFFSFFQLNSSYLGYITSLIAVICLSAGLRILSKEHKAYAKAYHISLVQLVSSTIIYILMGNSLENTRLFALDTNHLYDHTSI